MVPKVTFQQQLNHQHKLYNRIQIQSTTFTTYKDIYCYIPVSLMILIHEV